MNLQSFVPYLPFLAVFYAVFALIQTFRHKRQGTVAILLALVSIATPLLAYILSSDAILLASLVHYLAINAAIVFVTSILILFIDRRNAKCDRNRSYGMLGLGLSMLLAIGVFGLSLVGSSTSKTNASLANTINASNQSGVVLVSAVTTGVPLNQNSSDFAAEATQSVAASTPTGVATVLTAQTGLSTDELLSKIQAGSTIADLVNANNGKLELIMSAIAKSLDDLIKIGGQQAQMISSLGSDTTAIATQLVEGTLGQAQQFLLPQLITGQAPTPPSGNGAPPSGQLAGAPNTQAEATAEASGATNLNPASAGQVLVTNTPQSLQQSSSNMTNQAQLTSTETVIRPTQIVFPTATPTVAVTATPEATGTETTTTTVRNDTMATCSIVVDYNLNLRDQPTTDGSKVYLSIPFGTTVTADGRTTDGWYSVTYNGQKGWINNAYLTASASCASLSVLSGN